MRTPKIWLSCLVLGLLLTRTNAQLCVQCPSDANVTSTPGSAFGGFAHRNGADVNVSGQSISECETLVLRASVSYSAFGVSGGISAGFSGGTGHFILPDGTAVDVTPDDMLSTLVGPVPCGTTPVKVMKVLNYKFTDADLSAGSAGFVFEFTNAISAFTNVNGQCLLKLSTISHTTVSITPRPKATVVPCTNPVCAGSSATFTAVGTGAGPFSYSWSGPNGFSATNASITITNIQATNVGIYAVVVADQFGCATNAFGTLLLLPKFTDVRIAGSDLIISGCGGTSNGSYTLLTASNLATDPTVWLPLKTNNFDANGQFILTNNINMNETKRYFRLQVQ